MYGDPWPREPRLDPFRDAVWELSLDGEVVGHVLTAVGRMRSLPWFWVKQEWVWWQVHWLDGRPTNPQEDHGPGWLAVGELEQGCLVPDLDGVRYDARPVGEPERTRLWERYGAP
ncbi:hypothetical protein [Nocardioides sp. MH1]|uniref:hypothetical protein n=1 Tax=Nocardioides sp. MH1 TaxID=3242490 RepID=UPI003520AF57